MTRPARVTLDISEAQLMECVRELCSLLRLRAFHCNDSRGSWGPGFPDLVIVGPAGVLFRECKRFNGTTTASQDSWAVSLQEAGQNWGLWRPQDWASGRIRRELERLAVR